MVTVFCINNKCQRFEKVFYDFHKAKVFILRCRYGKNVFIEGFMTPSSEWNEELSRIFY